MPPPAQPLLLPHCHLLNHTTAFGTACSCRAATYLTAPPSVEPLAQPLVAAMVPPTQPPAADVPLLAQPRHLLHRRLPRSQSPELFWHWSQAGDHQNCSPPPYCGLLWPPVLMSLVSCFTWFWFSQVYFIECFYNTIKLPFCVDHSVSVSPAFGSFILPVTVPCTPDIYVRMLNYIHKQSSTTGLK